MTAVLEPFRALLLVIFFALCVAVTVARVIWENVR